MARKKDATVELKVRMKEPLRARIERAAAAKGISMNAEAVDRLERSLDRHDLLFDVLTMAYGNQAAGLVSLIGRPVGWAGRLAAFFAADTEASANWLSNPTAFKQAEEAITLVLDSLRPLGDDSGVAAVNNIGRQEAALAILELVGKRKPNDPVWAERARALLGDAIVRLGQDQKKLDVLEKAAEAPRRPKP